jgi:hypothetical protein
MAFATPLNPEPSEEFSRMCEIISSLDESMLLVVFINRYGRVLDTSLRDDGLIKSLLEEESRMLFMQRALQNMMLTDFNSKPGRFNYLIIVRDSTTEFVFPTIGGIVLVISSLMDNVQPLAEKIARAISLEFETQTLR